MASASLRVSVSSAVMTLPEKIGQMCHRAPEIPRLGIPAYSFANEALHGVARNGRAGDAILAAEGGDRSDIELPAVQQAFIKQLALTGARIVLVLTGGSPLALGEIVDLVAAVRSIQDHRQVYRVAH